MHARTQLQRKKAADRDAIPQLVHETLRSGGQPLDDATRAFTEPRFGHDFGQVQVQHTVPASTFQPKLTISQPGDPYEQEAERVADQVMRMPEPVVQRAAEEGEPEQEQQPIAQPTEEDKLVQRAAAEDEASEDQQAPVPFEEDQEQLVQPYRDSGQATVATPHAEANIAALRGSGQPLDRDTRAFMEPRFGHNFGHVRVHTGTQAAESARSVNARAYTIGSEVFFGAGQYQPSMDAGRRLLAHELTHVVQQRGSLMRMLQRKLITLDEIVISIPESRRSAILRRAGWKKKEVIITITNFLGEPLIGHQVYAEFNAPGIQPSVHGGPIQGGALMLSDVWLKPFGSLRLMAVHMETPDITPSGIVQYQLPKEGPLRFNAEQQKREITVKAGTNTEAAEKVGAKGTLDIDYKVVKVGGEVSGESSQTQGSSLETSWTVIMPGSAFKITQL
mgnify:CR=1 FL=1